MAKCGLANAPGNAVRLVSMLGVCAWALLAAMTGPVFASEAASETPVPPALRSGDAPLRVGDFIELKVWNEPELTVEEEISEAGVVVFPLIGPVQAAGRTTTELEQEVAERYASRYLVDPQVYITIVKFKSCRVYVLGAVGKPGVYDLAVRTTLLELLARCGGASANSSGTVMIIRQETKEPKEEETPGKKEGEATGAAVVAPIRVTLSALLRGNLTQNVVLKDRDVVLFPPSLQQREHVFVLGDVPKPGLYLLGEDGGLFRVLASAGVDPGEVDCTISILRDSPEGVERQTFKMAELFGDEERKTITLRTGDVLSVARASRVYYVVGEVKGPGCFRYRERLSVREAIILAGWINKVEGEWITAKAELSDMVEPGDVIRIGERWF